MDPAKASVLLGAALATLYLLLVPLVTWAISRAPLYIKGPWPWPLNEVTGDLVTFCSCAVVSVLLTCFAMELQCAPLRAIADRLNAPHPRAPESASWQREDPQIRGLADMEFEQWHLEARARPDMEFEWGNQDPWPRQGEHIDRLRAATSGYRRRGSDSDSSRELGDPNTGGGAAD